MVGFITFLLQLGTVGLTLIVLRSVIWAFKYLKPDCKFVPALFGKEGAFFAITLFFFFLSTPLLISIIQC